MKIDTETHCHCGAAYNGSDHCPACGCEQYESGDCGHQHVAFISGQYNRAGITVVDAEGGFIICTCATRASAERVVAALRAMESA